MAKLVDVAVHVRPDDYAAVAHLAPVVNEMRAEAESLVPQLPGQTVWMVNSTAKGRWCRGAVARDDLPAPGARCRDAVGRDRARSPRFFLVTKRLHNMIHGEGEPPPAPADRELFEAVSPENASALLRLIAPGDLLVVHDPQPLGAGALVKQELGLRAIWRCHIGLEDPPSPRCARGDRVRARHLLG